MCCYREDDDGNTVCGVCRLDRRGAYTEHMRGEHDDDVVLEPRKEVRVLARFEDGELGRIRTFSSSCVIDAGGARIAWLSDVAGDASVEWLATIVESSLRRARRPDDVAEGALSSLATHAGSEAFARLEGWATGRHPRKLREQAIFWLGAARGEEAWPTLVSLVNDAPDQGIRERAVFAAYVSDEPGAVDLLIGAARNDASTSVRRSALMWLAQLAGDRAIGAIESCARTRIPRCASRRCSGSGRREMSALWHSSRNCCSGSDTWVSGVGARRVGMEKAPPGYPAGLFRGERPCGLSY